MATKSPDSTAPAPTRARRGTARAEVRAQLTPENWIDAAVELLIHGSSESIRVDVLAKRLEVTRGSFYWHFADRDDLLTRVLLSWQEQQTEQVIARYRMQGVEAEALVKELVELPSHGRTAMKGAAIELAIRSWARNDEMARRIVDAVDAKRLAYLEEIFSKLSFPPPEAKSRAFILYCYMQSESLFRNQGSVDDKNARRRSVSAMLLDRQRLGQADPR